VKRKADVAGKRMKEEDVSDVGPPAAPVPVRVKDEEVGRTVEDDHRNQHRQRLLLRLG
jgi:hypothetical protein